MDIWVNGSVANVPRGLVVLQLLTDLQLGYVHLRVRVQGNVVWDGEVAAG